MKKPKEYPYYLGTVGPIKLMELEYGVMASSQTLWTDECTSICREHNVVDIRVFEHEQDMSFLKHFPDLTHLLVFGKALVDAAPLYQLTNLELFCIRDQVPPIEFDFTRFPKLRHALVPWWSGGNSIFDCSSLRLLTITGCKHKSFKPYTQLTNLQELEIQFASITDVDGISALEDLSSLSLYKCQKLSQLHGVDKLPKLHTLSLSYLPALRSLAGIVASRSLRSLKIDACKFIDSIEPTARIEQLQTLMITNSGEIESLAPLQGLSHLTSIDFRETNIKDGDLSCLFKMDALQNVAFDHKRHYSHSLKEWFIHRYPDKPWMHRHNQL